MIQMRFPDYSSEFFKENPDFSYKKKKIVRNYTAEKLLAMRNYILLINQLSIVL